MNFLTGCRFNKTSQNESIRKEIFRKSIHLSSAFVPLFAKFFYNETIIVLSAVTVFYIVFELLRLKGKNIILISRITKFAARKRDKGKFVLGPVTLSLGILIVLLMFPYTPAVLGILALSFGDGLASLIGKCFGKHPLPFIGSKTVAGSLSCFCAVYISSFCITHNMITSLVIAIVAMFAEALPLKDFDNILIPIVCAAAASLIYST